MHMRRSLLSLKQHEMVNCSVRVLFGTAASRQIHSRSCSNVHSPLAEHPCYLDTATKKTLHDPSIRSLISEVAITVRVAQMHVIVYAN